MKKLLYVFAITTALYAPAYTQEPDIRTLASRGDGITCATPEQMVQLLTVGTVDSDWDVDIKTVNEAGADCEYGYWAMFRGNNGPEVTARGFVWQVVDILVVGKNGEDIPPVKRATAFYVRHVVEENI